MNLHPPCHRLRRSAQGHGLDHRAARQPLPCPLELTYPLLRLSALAGGSDMLARGPRSTWRRPTPTKPSCAAHGGYVWTRSEHSPPSPVPALSSAVRPMRLWRNLLFRAISASRGTLAREAPTTTWGTRRGGHVLQTWGAAARIFGKINSKNPGFALVCAAT